MNKARYWTMLIAGFLLIMGGFFFGAAILALGVVVIAVTFAADEVVDAIDRASAGKTE